MAMLASPFTFGGGGLPAHATVGGCAQSSPAPLSLLSVQLHGLPFLTRFEHLTTLSQLWQKVSTTGPTAVEFAWNLITNDFAAESFPTGFDAGFVGILEDNAVSPILVQLAASGEPNIGIPCCVPLPAPPDWSFAVTQHPVTVAGTYYRQTDWRMATPCYRTRATTR
jgi:hypothetical protein